MFFRSASSFTGDGLMEHRSFRKLFHPEMLFSKTLGVPLAGPTLQHTVGVLKALFQLLYASA